jgi:anti-sigma B factor antagonist
MSMIEFREKPGSENTDGMMVLEVAGELDNYAVKDFTACLEYEIEKGHRRIIVDCSQLRFVSSMGVGTMVRIHGLMRKQGGDVKLASVKGMVADLFSLTKLDRLFNIYPDVDAAAAAFR